MPATVADLPTPDAVVFDLDGVLVDSEPIHFRATNRLLARFGAEISADDFRRCIGMGEADSWARWIKAYRLTAAPDELYREIELCRLAEIAIQVEPIAAAVALARDLDRRGIPLAIASASTQAVIGALLARLGLDKVFHQRISGEDPEVARSKPAPDIYHRACTVLNRDPRRCLAIEDSSPGVQAAKAAGLCCVAVPNYWTRDQDVSGADLVVESLDQLAPLWER